jgi:hypothetical protein
VCRFVGPDPITTLIPAEARWWASYRTAPGLLPERLTATETRLLFTITDMGPW